MKNLTKNLLLIIVLVALIIPSVTVNVAFAEEPYPVDGTYDVPIIKNIAMGGNKFADNVAVRKDGDKYYMTFTILNNESFDNLELDIEGAFQDVKTEGNKSRYTYLLTREQLDSELFFSVFIKKMGMTKTFSIELKNNEAQKVEQVQDKVDDNETPVWVYVVSVLAAVIGVAIIVTISVVVSKKNKKKKLS